MPGVVNNGLATVFTCTNVASTDIIVGVEAFGPAGGAALNDVSATSLTLAPGATARFGTKPMIGFDIDSALAVGLMHNGSARVLATARSGIICSVILADPLTLPPVVMVNLTIVKKTTQQGD